jgi:hypothetical protein
MVKESPNQVMETIYLITKSFPYSLWTDLFVSRFFLLGRLKDYLPTLSTALNYSALRLLGESVDYGPEMSMPKARKWIHDHGSATMIPILGKHVWVEDKLSKK